jgi:ribonuclease III family protein
MELDFIKRTFSVDEARQLNPLVMAFIGDAVFELIVRTYLVNCNTELSAHKLHVKAISYVKASAQSNFMKRVEGMLSEEELNIFKRGRNTKSATVPKNADVQEYRIATGFEALIGYLYLTKQEDRLMEIINVIICQ